MGPSCVAQICSTAASSSVFFASHPQPQSMKIAAFALLVANVASTSVVSREQSLLKDMSELLAEVDESPEAQQWWMEHRALLARGRPHQNFLQNDLEGVTKGDR